MKKTNFKVALACGGTGGHIFPAMAVKDEFDKLSINSVFITDIRGIKILKFQIMKIVNSGSPSAKGIKKVTNVLRIIHGVFQSLFFLSNRKIKLVIGFGGYPCVPVIIAAWLLRIPSIVHEQNKVIGRANRFCTILSKKIALSFEIERKDNNPKKYFITGHPVRSSISDIGLKDYCTKNKDSLRILIIGGSQGAKFFSSHIPNAFIVLPKKYKKNLFITHQARIEDLNFLKKLYKKLDLKAEVSSFFENISDYYKNCDLIISRSGASSVAEIAAAGRASILIPLKSSFEDHQTKNALSLVQAGAAKILSEREDFTKQLSLSLKEILSSPSIRKKMSENAKTVFVPNAANNLVRLGLSVCNENLK